MDKRVHDQVIDLIPAYALGALDDDELVFIESHLPECERCRRELIEYDFVAAKLALAVPDWEPSPALKGRLMERIAPSIEMGSRSHLTASSFGQRLMDSFRKVATGPRWQLAGGFLIIVLIISNFVFWQQANQRQSNRAPWRIVRLTGAKIAPDATGIIYISEDGLNGTIVVDKLPPLGGGNQYQLWLIRDGLFTSGGIFEVNQQGYRGFEIFADEPLRDFEAFSITVEPAGGSQEPTGHRVLQTDS